MSSSNVAAFIVSRHQGDAGWDYRVHLANGTMRLMPERSVRCLVRGDIAIEEFDPDEWFEGLPPPETCMSGPSPGDVIRVLLDDAWHVCTVLEVDPLGPKYRVRYDDGMLVFDRLSVPWTYVSSAVQDAPRKSTWLIIKVPTHANSSSATTAEPMTVEPVTDPASPELEPAAEPAAKPSVATELEPAAEPSVAPAAEPSVAPAAEPAVAPLLMSEKQRGKLPMYQATAPYPTKTPLADTTAMAAWNSSCRAVSNYAALLDNM